jgi:hypothetical protein
MLKKIKQGMFPFLIGFSALSVSASAAFYSVSGLSKLFAGASLEVIIMAGSLEFAKLVTASLLYQYWDTINKTLRTYLSIATIILVLITSMGIYGFLSSAYQETYSKLSAVENEKEFIQQKINFYGADVTRYDEELKRISNNISTLSNARSQQIQVRDTSVVGGVRTTISTSELRVAQARIKTEEQNRKNVQSQREIAADSLRKFQLQVLELDNNTEVAGELGPLQYLSGLTGTSMDKIINILLLIIIFVFDPLAISLVVASNFAFEKAYPKKKYKQNLYGEKVEEKNIYSVWDSTLNDGLENEPEWKYTTNIDPKDLEVKDAEEIKSQEEFFKNLDQIEKIKSWEEAEKRMEIIGQNGNDGEHYSKLDLNKDGVIDENEIKQAKKTINELENHLQTSISSWRKNKIRQEIELIKQSLLKDNDQTKTY